MILDNFPYRMAYFIGLGGIGMSALAQFFKKAGMHVEGYDKTPSSVTDRLQSMGIPCRFEEDLEYLQEILKSYSKNEILIIYTPAVPKTHLEYQWLIHNGYIIRKRAEILGEISRFFPTIAIAGTHGKTSTTTFVTHLLKTAGKKVLSFMGGISVNYDTNFLLPDNLSDPESVWMIAEADEYDRSFLHLRPSIGIITSTDPDHLDIYSDSASFKKGFSEFSSYCKDYIIVNKHVENEFTEHKNKFTYSIDLNSTCYVRSLDIKNAVSYFIPSCMGNTLGPMELNIPGRHNVENVLAGILLGKLMQIPDEVINKAVKTFRGVERRFDIRIKTNDLIFIDDYAHHPTEIAATLKSVKEYFPGKKIRVVFQPHLFTRTRDFMDRFAESLSLADEVWLLDIYPAREEPIEGVSSQALLEKIRIAQKKHVTKEQVLNECLNGNPQVLITMGAGDIDRLVKPIENKIKKQKKIEA
ncbi:MAG: UDP-N-acetylmuramate--L-alanine ligase [Bacteroidia bacterium]|nr:UDP-N-acetylmuramate--L-alanine ligase [Bacteroidia bacterium]